MAGPGQARPGREDSEREHIHGGAGSRFGFTSDRKHLSGRRLRFSQD